MKTSDTKVNKENLKQLLNKYIDSKEKKKLINEAKYRYSEEKIPTLINTINTWKKYIGTGSNENGKIEDLNIHIIYLVGTTQEITDPVYVTKVHVTGTIKNDDQTLPIDIEVSNKGPYLDDNYLNFFIHFAPSIALLHRNWCTKKSKFLEKLVNKTNEFGIVADHTYTINDSGNIVRDITDDIATIYIETKNGTKQEGVFTYNKEWVTK